MSIENISYLDISANYGKAEAVRLGVIQAISAGYTYIGYFDADLSTPLDEVNRLQQTLSHSDSVDITIGSRIKMLGYEIERSLLRHVIGRVFATFASIALQLPVYDTQCGAKLFKNNPELRILFNDQFINKWTFDVEIIKRHLILGTIKSQPICGIQEVPLRKWKDTAGSRVKPIDFFIAMVDIIRIAYHYRKQSTMDHYKNLVRNSG
jgi:hypothetical protein